MAAVARLDAFGDRAVGSPHCHAASRRARWPGLSRIFHRRRKGRALGASKYRVTVFGKLRIRRGAAPTGFCQENQFLEWLAISLKVAFRLRPLEPWGTVLDGSQVVVLGKSNCTGSPPYICTMALLFTEDT